MVRRIAITQREVENTGYPDPRDALSQDWAVFMSMVFPAAALLPVPNRTPDITAWFKEVKPDLIVFSGGNDWGSATYRDPLEADILVIAKTAAIPTLFTCRGFQVLASLSGVRVVVNLGAETAENHVAQSHEVVLSGSAFVDHAGGRHRVEVNSYHNQGVMLDDLDAAGDLLPFASTDGGVLEGFIHRTLPFLGIQWHPERTGSDPAFDISLITALANKGAFWA